MIFPDIFDMSDSDRRIGNVGGERGRWGMVGGILIGGRVRICGRRWVSSVGTGRHISSRALARAASRQKRLAKEGNERAQDEWAKWSARGIDKRSGSRVVVIQ